MALTETGNGDVSAVVSAVMVGIAGILVILSSLVIFAAARAVSLQANNITVSGSAQAVNNILNTSTPGSNLSSEIYYSYQNARNASVNSLNSEASTGYVLGIMTLVDGVLMLVAAFFINKEAYRSKKWPILGFAFSAVSIFFGGGFILGFILGMIGALAGMGASRKSNRLQVDNGL